MRLAGNDCIIAGHDYFDDSCQDKTEFACHFQAGASRAGWTYLHLYKFRSMMGQRNENGELLPDEVRLISFGCKLCSTSIDELPELFNILRGDRGIIGTTKKNIDFSSVVTA